MRQFRNRNEIATSARGSVVPLHIEGRKSVHTEEWSLSRYLLALADAALLTYPLTAIHADESRSPDYMLMDASGARTGLEISEASTPEFHRELINNERGIENRNDLQPGWLEDQAEREWAALAFAAIRIKAAKLAGGEWDPADAYDLLLYANNAPPVFYPEKALHFLRGHLSGYRSGFRAISIINAGGTRLLYDVANESRILPIAVS